MLIQPGRYHVVCQAGLSGALAQHEYDILVRPCDMPQKAVCKECGTLADFTPTASVYRFDHAYEDGAYDTCRRCGMEKQEHDR